MKKIIQFLGFFTVLGLGIVGFTVIYLRLDKIDGKIESFTPRSQNLANTLPSTQNGTSLGANTNTNNNDPRFQPSNEGGQLNQTGQNLANELSTHNTYLTTSTEASGFVLSEEAIFTGASVPEVVQLTQASSVGVQGDLLLYFVDASTLTSPGAEQIGFARSTDQGKTWSEKTTITVSGKANAGPIVDPSLVQLSDGSVRMYFYGATKISDPATDTSQHLVYSAVSTDGKTFVVEDGVRFSAQKLTDPEVVEVASNNWVMYYSLGTTTGIATSTDGLEFEHQGEWDGGGVPGAYVDANGITHLYGCNPQGFMTSSSVDGTTFVDEPTAAFSGTAPGICDPSPVLLEDGTVLMIYKRIDR